MKRRTAIKISIGLVIVFSMTGLFLLIPAERIVPFWLGRHSDEIEMKRIETEWILKKYQMTGFAGEAKNWLARYHGEAPGQQVFYSFVHWGAGESGELYRFDGRGRSRRAREIGGQTSDGNY